MMFIFFGFCPRRAAGRFSNMLENTLAVFPDVFRCFAGISAGNINVVFLLFENTVIR